LAEPGKAVTAFFLDDLVQDASSYLARSHAITCHAVNFGVENFLWMDQD